MLLVWINMFFCPLYLLQTGIWIQLFDQIQAEFFDKHKEDGVIFSSGMHGFMHFHDMKSYCFSMARSINFSEVAKWCYFNVLFIFHLLIWIFYKEIIIIYSLCMCADLLSRVRLFVTLWTIAHQAPLSMGFSRQEYWSGLPALLQGIFLTQVSNWCLLHLLYCRQTLY